MLGPYLTSLAVKERKSGKWHGRNSKNCSVSAEKSKKRYATEIRQHTKKRVIRHQSARP